MTTTTAGRKISLRATRVLLSLYTEKLVLPPQQGDTTLIERLFAAFTLRCVLLLGHWCVSLLTLAGVNTAMFTIQTGGMFTVSERPRSQLTVKGPGRNCAVERHLGKRHLGPALSIESGYDQSTSLITTSLIMSGRVVLFNAI
ncbi:hypothetical protein HYPSUDRAFT_209559 [Hypholoma sublateritium FD-334 SS-4]|uniref:Uncharacterized protein n=1 Tax=Hypholoma sublateritium (strain FD-334 SS-4) TaxID=945553 RepID=A0A0D2LRF9_HYPSF|nr:hypothetical protein HYPSUDRAFT_209559 [Hypholoma sublateritium FD-334 SS-4]